MDPKPFTYEHFIQAVQSLKDDMLMYYIDEAVAIYCRIKVILSDFKALHFRVESSDHDPLVNVKEMSREASLKIDAVMTSLAFNHFHMLFL